MNTRQKGMQFQNWIEKFLIKKNYIVHNQKSVATQITTKEGKQIWVSRRNDLFGCFDLVAITPQGEVIFIAATCHSDWKKDIKKMKKITDLPMWEFEAQIWQKIKGGRIKIYQWQGAEFELVREVQRGKILSYERRDIRDEKEA